MIVFLIFSPLESSWEDTDIFRKSASNSNINGNSTIYVFLVPMEMEEGGQTRDTFFGRYITLPKRLCEKSSRLLEMYGRSKVLIRSSMNLGDVNHFLPAMCVLAWKYHIMLACVVGGLESMKYIHGNLRYPPPPKLPPNK